MKKKPIITIIGKRWFQRSYGNTYHTVAIYVDGKHVATSRITYGYGEHYLQTAHELLQEHGCFPKTGKRLNGTCYDYYTFRREMFTGNPNSFVVSVSDVERKKDL